ncbi:MAG: hypothetical protein COA85_09180 [Robiginitomaculum sp.]|nr:MAG: hypothetical protein COA85_09180 [Robiginitomaculum sp.]
MGKTPALLVVIFALVGAMPVMAQNASQIEKIRNGGKTCPRCNLFQADFSYLNLPWRTLNGARLRQADLSLSTMDHSNFSAADLSVANMFGGRFTRASFINTNLRKANMVGVYAGYADFTGADLTGACLSGANLVGAHIRQQQLDKACGDDSTILPNGLTIPTCR